MSQTTVRKLRAPKPDPAWSDLLGRLVLSTNSNRRTTAMAPSRNVIRINAQIRDDPLPEDDTPARIELSADGAQVRDTPLLTGGVHAVDAEVPDKPLLTGVAQFATPGVRDEPLPIDDVPVRSQPLPADGALVHGDPSPVKGVEDHEESLIAHGAPVVAVQVCDEPLPHDVRVLTKTLPSNETSGHSKSLVAKGAEAHDESLLKGGAQVVTGQDQDGPSSAEDTLVREEHPRADGALVRDEPLSADEIPLRRGAPAADIVPVVAAQTGEESTERNEDPNAPIPPIPAVRSYFFVGPAQAWNDMIAHGKAAAQIMDWFEQHGEKSAHLVVAVRRIGTSVHAIETVPVTYAGGRMIHVAALCPTGTPYQQSLASIFKRNPLGTFLGTAAVGVLAVPVTAGGALAAVGIRAGAGVVAAKVAAGGAWFGALANAPNEDRIVRIEVLDSTAILYAPRTTISSWFQ